MDDAAARLAEVRQRVAEACRRAGRPAGAALVVGAAKTVAPPRLAEYLRAGLTDVGENYVQEARAARRELGVEGDAVRWHLIGGLQTTKARDAVRCFSLVHSVDRLELAQAIDREAGRQGKAQAVLLQVNLAGEASKSGCRPEELPALAAVCAALPHLAARGLMCLPPFAEEPEASRLYFRRLAELLDEVAHLIGEGRDGTDSWPVPGRHLSMGMSRDFEVAVEEGATLVRIGTVLFGERPPAHQPRPGLAPAAESGAAQRPVSRISTTWRA